jgi:hypothetical protein
VNGADLIFRRAADDERYLLHRPTGEVLGRVIDAPCPARACRRRSCDATTCACAPCPGCERRSRTNGDVEGDESFPLPASQLNLKEGKAG